MHFVGMEGKADKWCTSSTSVKTERKIKEKAVTITRFPASAFLFLDHPVSSTKT